MPRKKKQEPEILSEEISQTETENQENEETSARGTGDLSENTEDQSESDTGGEFPADGCLEGGLVGQENLENLEDQGGYDTEGDFSTAEAGCDSVGAWDTDFGSESDTGEENLPAGASARAGDGDMQSGYDTEGKNLSTGASARAGDEDIQGGYDTGEENLPTEDTEGTMNSDFGSESDTEEKNPDMKEEGASESAVGINEPEDEKRTGRRTRTGTAGTAAPGHPAGRRAGRPAPVRTGRGVLSIDGQLLAETDAEKARNDLLDLLESQKTGRILTGTIQGVEQPPNDQSRSFAVIYHGDLKVIIPAEEAVEIPENLCGREPADVLHYMLTKRLGAEVDYIVRGLDQEAGMAAASRLAAMRARISQKRRDMEYGEEDYDEEDYDEDGE